MTTRKILLIDDDRLQARLVQQQVRVFRGEPFEFEWAPSFEEGLTRLLQGRHTVCLLDYQLGSRDGLELIREARAAHCEVPIIFLTADSSERVDVDAMNAGALDYLVKGEISPAMLERSIRYALKLSETLAELRRLATRDALTGLLNRRELNRVLEEETDRATRFDRRLSLVLLDLDHFKSVNDQHGHPAGDAVLKEIARRIQAEVREVDRVARYGGEELAVVLIELNHPAAMAVAERLLAVVRQAPVPLEDGGTLAVTASAGVATLPDAAGTVRELIERADRALYAAKLAGRDRVAAAD